ncbi:MAG: branched-chain amino acid ABC transporter permease [Acidimicrobiaceae bacterium]|nr:branched-chain amino acid ABC transporter permease [Acidimicrobiaceae bacterium]
MSLLLQTLYSGLVNGALYGLIGLGIVLCYRSSGVVNLAQGEAFTVTGLITAEIVRMGVPVLVAAALGLLCAVLFGAGLERVILRPRLGWSSERLIILVVAVALCTEGIANFAVGPNQFSFRSLVGNGTVRLSNAVMTFDGLVLIGILLLVGLLISWFLHRTIFGQGLSACAENPTMSSLLGINVSMMRMIAFGTAGFLGGLAALLLVPLSIVTYNAGLSLTLLGYVAAALAAMKSPIGACLAGLLVGVAESLIGSYVNQLLAEPLVLGVLIVVAVALLGRRVRFGGVVRA